MTYLNKLCSFSGFITFWPDVRVRELSGQQKIIICHFLG